ncbi:MAG TPA: methionyl-tRNA formyltransferase, partial [Usitatibacteraceae bacterium]|nr:methionyl-tRNA formyltransferase [Usitatibacteraceae bacterium]
DPFPGNETRIGETPLKIWRAHVVPSDDPQPPGTVLEAGPRLLVRCGQQALAIDQLQKPGGRRLTAAEFLRGTQLERGTRLA